MANKNLLTSYAKVIQSELTYYYPTLTYPLNPDIKLATIYCFLSKAGPWPDDTNPPIPTQDQRSIKNMYKNMFVMKQINSNNITPVIPKVNWASGITYDYYRDDIDMFSVDQNNIPMYNFYVINKYDQVFKCLWNANGNASTVEPYFEPGTYGTNNIFQGSDGYKWKFMFSVDFGLKSTFMDNSWIPLPVGVFAIGAENELVSCGDIEVINVTNGGSGYDPANSQITISITGDGTGATATPVVNTASGIITDIVVTNIGQNYTYANVTISSAVGSGAVAIAPVSPIGGHGSDPTSELGAVYDMLVCEFNGTENGNIPGNVNDNIQFHQIGLLVNPSDATSNPNPASGEIYPLTTDLVVAPGFGSYLFDEMIYQGDVNNPTFSATVLHFEYETNVLYLININGTPTINAPVFSTVSGTTRTLLTYSTPNVIPYSGYIYYVENRTGVQRSVDGIEQFKLILSY